MHRHELTLEHFAKVEHILPGSKGHVGVSIKDNHNFFNEILCILKTGAPLAGFTAAIRKMYIAGLPVGLQVESLRRS